MNLYRMLYNEVLIHNQVTKQYSNNKIQLWLFLSVFLHFPYYFTLTSSLLFFLCLGPPEKNTCWFFSHTWPAERQPQHLSAAVLPLHSAPGAHRQAREDLHHVCFLPLLFPCHFVQLSQCVEEKWHTMWLSPFLSLLSHICFFFFSFFPKGSAAPAASGSQSSKENACRVKEESC